MNKEINIGDLGVFSGRVDKKVKVIRVDEKYVTYLIIDENKKKYIYLEDFKKKFKKEGDSVLEKGESKIESKIKKIAEEKKAKNTSKPIYTIVGVIYDKDKGDIEETENLEKKDIKGYRIRYNKEPKMYFGHVEYDENNLQEAKKRLEYLNERAEKQKEIQKIREAENKIKREENKILEKAKLEAANKEIVKKPAYLMTLTEYQDKVVPILQEYQKFLRKNSQYLQSAGYEGIYQYTYPELEADFENNTIKGQRFAISKYKENPLSDFKASHYPTDEIVETNKSFVNKLKNYFTDSEIYSEISKDEFKSNKRAIKRAIDNDVYKKLLESGELTESELETIAKSVDVSIPKKVFSVENVKAKEMKTKFEKLLVDLPTISKEQLEKLIESIKIDFKPLEEEVFSIEKARYIKTFEELVSEAKVYETRLNYVIPIWQQLFTYDKRGYDEIKTGTYYRSFGSRPAEEIIEQKYYVTGLKLKSDWETTFDKFLKDYIDTLKYSFISAIINNFTRITKPITEFEKLRIRKGEKGFEGVYRFKFDDGSYFDFKAEAIRAGGYNIQVLHLRYITNFENITLSDGTKVTGYSSLIENFNVKRMKHGGLTITDMKNKTDKYKDILKKPSNLLKISQMHKVPVEFLQSQLVKGMKVESEHTKREAIAKIIALHHLEEDPRYYMKLEEIEKNKMTDGGNIKNPIDLLISLVKNKGSILFDIDFKSPYIYYESQSQKLKLKYIQVSDYPIDGEIKVQFIGVGSTMFNYENNELIYEKKLFNFSNKFEEEFVNGEWVVGYKKYGKIEEKNREYGVLSSNFILTNEIAIQILENLFDKKMADGGELSIGDKVTIDKNYGGGSGVVKDIIGSFVVVKTNDGNKSYHESNLTLQEDNYEDEENYKKGGQLDPDDKNVKSVMTHKAGAAGGLLVGKRHSEGGIKAINKSTNSPIEMEGGEVVITRNAVSDNSKREFEGQMLTNRQILSKINESGGGVSFASGGDVPSSCKCSGKSYKYGGEMISDYDIVKRINSKY